VDRCQESSEIKASSHTDPPDPPLTPTFAEITAHEQKLTPNFEGGVSDAKENFGKSLKKGGSVAEVDRCQDNDKPRVVATDPPSDPPLDYSSYPHLTCNSIEAKRNQAQKIKQRLLEADSREDLTAIKQEFGDRFVWVWKHLLTDAERGRLRAIAQTEQLNLLELTQNEVAGADEQPLDEITNTAKELVKADECNCLADVLMSFVKSDWWLPMEQQVLECLPQPLKSKVQELLRQSHTS
jgi:hypothetical protein